MSLAELVNKLLVAGAMEKRGRELTFTIPFGSYLVWSVGTISSSSTCLEEWNEILGGFDSSLGSLSSEEITSIILLLEYYLNHAETPVPAEQ